MTSNPWPVGLMTALVTPLKDDKVDVAAMGRLIDFQIASGASGLVVSGGTGEYSALSYDERSQLFRDTVRLAGGRVPVVAATGCLTNREALRLSKDAQAAGVTGLLLASPFGEPINWRERLAFYEELDAGLSIPIMIYNTPPAGLLTFDQIARLSELKNVTAVKDSSGNPELMGDLIAFAKKSDFAVYVGKDSFLLEAVSTGARGVVFGAANFMPAELSKLIAMIKRSGTTPDVLDLWSRIRPLLRNVEYASNYVGLCKAGCKMRGIDVGDVRRPYLMADAAEIAQLERSLKTLG